MYTLSYFLIVMRRLIDFAALKFPGGHGGKPSIQRHPWSLGAKVGEKKPAENQFFVADGIFRILCCSP